MDVNFDVSATVSECYNYQQTAIPYPSKVTIVITPMKIDKDGSFLWTCSMAKSCHCSGCAYPALKG